ncbi:MAG: hypothetical protein E6H84_13520 [Chloroflexi bacterium]|nr:MAG: hypothetical protein E6H84_13520 [Chloroflexota bacterium]TMG68685.1 MAG: hypothetical protein E6H81_12080 [Chloroflexota bacterium]
MQATFYDLEIVLQDKPGTLAKATEAIAQEQINLEGGATFKCGGEGIFHALFKTEKDATSAKKSLEKIGFKVREQTPVVVTDAEDKPGGAAKIYRSIAEQEVNVNFTYLATNTRVVIGADDPQKVTDALRSPTSTGVRR